MQIHTQPHAHAPPPAIDSLVQLRQQPIRKLRTIAHQPVQNIRFGNLALYGSDINLLTNSHRIPFV